MWTVHSVPLSWGDCWSHRRYRDGAARLQLSPHLDIQRGVFDRGELHHARIVRHGGCRGGSRRGHEDDSVIGRDHVRTHRGRQVHRPTDGRCNGKQMGRRCAGKTGHLRCSHRIERVSVPGQQRRVPAYHFGCGRYATQVSAVFYKIKVCNELKTEILKLRMLSEETRHCTYLRKTR